MLSEFSKQRLKTAVLLQVQLLENRLIRSKDRGRMCTMTRAWETFGIEQVRSFWKVLVKMKLLELNRLPELNMLPEFGHSISFKTLFAGLC